MVASMRLGDSYSTVVIGRAAISARRSRRSRPVRGRKPSTVKRSVGSPLIVSAATAATGPGTDETAAGVGDAGGAGVGDDGDVVAVSEYAEHLVDAVVFGVIVGHDQALGADAGVPQQRSGAAGVLAADERDGVEHLDRTRREVAEVADRRGDEPEGAAHGVRISTTSPTRRPQRENAPASASIT